MLEILSHLVSAQDTMFGLLERPQRPTHTRQLYFLSAVLGGQLAVASENLADFPAALAQSRTAWLCAEQADHDGARAWITVLQSMVSYRANRPHDSIRYAQRGTSYGQRAGNTATARLPASEARAWGLLGNAEAAREAVDRAERAWDHVRPDELDDLGGIATFGRPRQLFYAADALSRVPAESAAAEDYARQAVAAHVDPSQADWTYGNSAASRACLALARIARGEIEGATDALAPVFESPAEQRISLIIESVNRV